MHAFIAFIQKHDIIDHCYQKIMSYIEIKFNIIQPAEMLHLIKFDHHVKAAYIIFLVDDETHTRKLNTSSTVFVCLSWMDIIHTPGMGLESLDVI